MSKSSSCIFASASESLSDRSDSSLWSCWWRSAAGVAFLLAVVVVVGACAGCWSADPSGDALCRWCVSLGDTTDAIDEGAPTVAPCDGCPADEPLELLISLGGPVAEEEWNSAADGTPGDANIAPSPTPGTREEREGGRSAGDASNRHARGHQRGGGRKADGWVEEFQSARHTARDR